MSEQAQPDKKPLTDEEVNELLQGDYAVDEASGDRTGGEKLEILSGTEIWREVIQNKAYELYCSVKSGDIQPKEASENFLKLVSNRRVKIDTEGESAGSSEVPQSPVKELEASAHDLNKDFVTLVIPKDWADQSLYVSVFDDGWEVCRAKDHPLGDFSKSDWNNEKENELIHLELLKRELTDLLELIKSHVVQIKETAKIMREGEFTGGEYRGMQKLIEHLCYKICCAIDNNLKVKTEVIKNDLWF
ncbi:MAG: hypothetical protein VKK42_03400 [Lyngbya sp.]|nr:hypothetical protein [Lyngbya sp.]